MISKITITINTGGSAFCGGTNLAEVARILTEIAEKCSEDNALPASLCDINGNSCCTIKVK